MEREKEKLKFNFPSGATPLDPNETRGLIPKFISSQSELNILEQENILEAEMWLGSKSHKVLSEAFVRELHRKMFSNVWKWAGKYRLSDKSIGISWLNVPVEIGKLISDTEYWIQHNTFEWDELAIRFHHRLVFIHAFPNGNGRHARMLTNLLLKKYDQKTFTWGSDSPSALASEGDVRTNYIQALREADQRRYMQLMDFVRS